MKKLLILTLAGMALLPSLAFAKPAEPEIISEKQVVQAAMQSSPDIQGVLKDAANAKADADQEGRLANPTAKFDAKRTSTPGDDSNSFDVEIEQPLKLSQLTGTRTMLSNTLFEQASLREQHGMIGAVWNVRMLYADVWKLQEQERLYTEFKKRAEDVSAKINKAVKAGQTPISEGSLFQGDVAKFSSDLEQIKARQAQLRLQLEKATGLSLLGRKLEKPELDTIASNSAELEKTARENASLVRLLETDLKAAERKKYAAIADSAGPEIAPRFIYGRNPDDKEDTVGFGVVLTIPLWDRNQSERQKADAERRFAQSQLDGFQQMPLGERLSRILEGIERLDRRIDTLGNDALPNYRQAFAQAQKSFGAGQMNAAALWQIRERLFETESQAIDAHLEALEARRLLSLETGTLPQEVTQ